MSTLMLRNKKKEYHVTTCINLFAVYRFMDAASVLTVCPFLNLDLNIRFHYVTFHFPPRLKLLPSRQCCIKYFQQVFQLHITKYILKKRLNYFCQLLWTSGPKYKKQNTFNKIN